MGASWLERAAEREQDERGDLLLVALGLKPGMDVADDDVRRTSIARTMRPVGRVVLVESRGGNTRVPIKGVHKMTEKQMRLEAAEHALAWEHTAGTLPWQHVQVSKQPCRRHSTGAQARPTSG